MCAQRSRDHLALDSCNLRFHLLDQRLQHLLSHSFSQIARHLFQSKQCRLHSLEAVVQGFQRVEGVRHAWNYILKRALLPSLARWERVALRRMTGHPDVAPSIAEICASVKRLGYGVSQSIRLYGEEFEVISDPFVESGGIAVRVRSKKRDVLQTLQLPTTVLQSVGKPRATAA
jgi:hypothetical protein